MLPIALLDANVLFPMILRDTLLRVAAAGCYRVHWSNRILDEMARNLIDQYRVSAKGVHRLVAEMTRAFPEAMVEGWEALEADMRNHPDDRHVAAAAAHIGASLIVTANLKDFAALPAEIRAIGPDDFLMDLFADMPERIILALEKQAAAYRNPPANLTQLIDWLTPTVPTFAARVRAYVEKDRVA